MQVLKLGCTENRLTNRKPLNERGGVSFKSKNKQTNGNLLDRPHNATKMDQLLSTRDV